MVIDKALVIESFDNKPLVEIEGYQFVVNPLTEQVPATSAELLRETTKWLLQEGQFESANKIVGEEDKGAILVASTSLMANLPFGMARWYPSGLQGQIMVDFKMEYAQGQLFLNGVESRDRVIIVDDLISTGGTMVALIRAIELAKAEIVDIICVAEKIGYGGIDAVKEQTGHQVKTLLRISVDGAVSRVVS